MILGLASHFRKWCRQRRRTGSILPTSGLVEQNNFWLARDSLSIDRKRQWRFQIPRTGLMTRSDARTLLFRHVWCPKSFGASLLYVGGFAPQLKWLICREAQPQRRLGS